MFAANLTYASIYVKIYKIIGMDLNILFSLGKTARISRSTIYDSYTYILVYIEGVEMFQIILQCLRFSIYVCHLVVSFVYNTKYVYVYIFKLKRIYNNRIYYTHHIIYSIRVHI